MKNYYEILEVSKNASKDTINKIFKIHMKANHPDLFQGEEKTKAEEKSKELTEAYNILSDDAQRAKYDAELEAEESSSSYNDIQAILDENEYLKQVIAKKDEFITMLTGNAQGYNNPYNTQYGQNPNPYQYQQQQQYQQQYANQNTGYGFNGFSPNPNRNPYEGISAEDLKKVKKEQTIEYYKQVAKDTGIKIVILLLIVAVLIISLFSSFKDLVSLFN